MIYNSDSEYSMEHWDVKIAFTQAAVEEELYHAPTRRLRKGWKRKTCVQTQEKSLWFETKCKKFLQSFARQVERNSTPWVPTPVFTQQENGKWYILGRMWMTFLFCATKGEKI